MAIFLAPPPIARTPETAFIIKLYQQNPRIGSHDGFQIGLFCVGLASLTGKLTGVFFPTVPLRFLHESCAGWCWCCIFLSFSFINIKTYMYFHIQLYTPTFNQWWESQCGWCGWLSECHRKPYETEYCGGLPWTVNNQLEWVIDDWLYIHVCCSYSYAHRVNPCCMMSAPISTQRFSITNYSTCAVFARMRKERGLQEALGRFHWCIPFAACCNDTEDANMSEDPGKQVL